MRGIKLLIKNLSSLFIKGIVLTLFIGVYSLLFYLVHYVVVLVVFIVSKIYQGSEGVNLFRYFIVLPKIISYWGKIVRLKSFIKKIDYLWVNILPEIPRDAQNPFVFTYLFRLGLFDDNSK